MKILHIDASARGTEVSHSRRLSADIVARLKQVHPDATVMRRDVAADLLPHVDFTIRTAWSPEGQADPAQAETGRRSRALVEELKSAGVIVLGTPMYNFSVPSTLKAWIDHVAISGQTFSYSEAGPKGLLEGKTVHLALSSDGVYSSGPAAGMNFLETYLRAVLGFIGLTDVNTVWAEGNARGPEVEAKAMQAARDRIRDLIAA